MNRFYKTFSGVTLLLLYLVSSVALAQTGTKIGYTDAERLIANMPEYRTVMQQVQTFYQTKQQELQQEQVAFEQAVGEYQKQQSLMTAEAKQSRETELATQQQKLQQNAVVAEGDVGKKQQELLSPLFDQVNKIIDEVAKAQNLTMVVNSQMVLFANETQTVDITKAVAEKLGIPMQAQQ